MMGRIPPPPPYVFATSCLYGTSHDTVTQTVDPRWTSESEAVLNLVNAKPPREYRGKCRLSDCSRERASMAEARDYCAEHGRNLLSWIRREP